MDAAALVHRAAFDDDCLARRPSPPAEDRSVLSRARVPELRGCGAVTTPSVLASIAFRKDWIDQLFVLRAQMRAHRHRAFERSPKAPSARLQLWTFQRNWRPRRLYGARGFDLVGETDGARNEQQEPDARYLGRVPDFRRNVGWVERVNLTQGNALDVSVCASVDPTLFRSSQFRGAGGGAGVVTSRRSGQAEPPHREGGAPPQCPCSPRPQHLRRG